MVPYALLHLCASKSEVPAAILSPIDKSMERLTLAIPIVANPQEEASNSYDLMHVPAERAMPKATVPVVGPVPHPWHHETQNKPIAAL